MIPDVEVQFPQLVENFGEFNVNLTPTQTRQLERLEQPIRLREAADILRAFYRRVRNHKKKRALLEYFDPWNYYSCQPGTMLLWNTWAVQIG